MATLWLYLTLTQNVHVVIRKALARTLMLKRSLVKLVRVSLKIRRNSWPPLLTGHVRSSRRRQASPPDCWSVADVTVLGQVESKGETSDRGKTASKNLKKSSHKSPSKKKAGKTPVF